MTDTLVFAGQIEEVTAYCCPGDCGSIYEDREDALGCCEDNGPKAVPAFKCGECGTLHTNEYGSGEPDATECCTDDSQQKEG